MDAMPTRHYCTLFDSNYLIKGLAMYQSLEKHGDDFSIHILCMDDVAYDLLTELKLRRAVLIRLAEFEDAALLAIKSSRTIAEYCWTCAPCLPVHILERHPEIDFITYLDADLLFYSSLQPIYDEIGAASSVIVEHRFSPRFMPAIVNGRYNVQWVSFRRDAAGLETLYWWRDRCIEWCFYRLEDDRMGDQKYLDCWTKKFQGVHELQHIGAGTAPWNYANYRIREEDDEVRIDDVPLIFYHFHSYRLLPEGQSIPMPATYMQDGHFPAPIYRRYDRALAKSLSTIREIAPGFSRGIENPGDRPHVIPTTHAASGKRQGAPLVASVRAMLKRLLGAGARSKR
jgi:hypothetical protein